MQISASAKGWQGGPFTGFQTSPANRRFDLAQESVRGLG